MLPLAIQSPEDAALEIAHRCRALRLHRNLTQAGLAAAAGVSAASLKRFERTGEIAFRSLVRIAMALDATAALDGWFAIPEFRSIDEAIARSKAPTRKRGRLT
jgi:transcriptional regulator with XRE-family HTH domain